MGVYKINFTKRIQLQYTIYCFNWFKLQKKSWNQSRFKHTFLQNSFNQIQDYDGYRDNKDQDIMFFRTNQQDLSRLTDIQLLVSQKLETDIS